ncbi:uncharacterized protein MONOS_3278 [Monocercomonoides exilis]|uniref:uncharacterized protein n=1 Tax=Monocercomonoides exilis TaxID=2049356 RepID=UPI0035596AEC|nr:hypothetical protein MONOS_3278 [Monocercomonoides exilis]|eukprot:MONOS_3278.1-p1 / transcript=MONOS_3278.1 / gene=MONOS_3278 / organism=Monocercomonoides_exilis_PA203 / gene_product=unspecified product / transcript_product=unspecified product / location=Mono_scaffold00076:22441-23052(-) / protein_length=204 / sequence_SO=supercontig / SO=protein_coding / is_pseudo=false
MFSENEAFVGRNMYILSSDLNSSVVIERLMFDWTEWKNTTAFFGADGVNFTEGISLDKLLFEHTDTSVVVLPSGRDIRGCGSEREPCLSFWEGMRHFREGIQFREIKINTSVAISDELDLSNSSISPAIPSSPAILLLPLLMSLPQMNAQSMLEKQFILFLSLLRLCSQTSSCSHSPPSTSVCLRLSKHHKRNFFSLRQEQPR